MPCEMYKQFFFKFIIYTLKLKVLLKCFTGQCIILYISLACLKMNWCCSLNLGRSVKYDFDVLVQKVKQYMQ